MSAQAFTNVLSSEDRYRSLMTFWLLFAYDEDTDQQELRKLHAVLCEQEQLLCERMLRECLETLRQRLLAGQQLGITLCIPEWAVQQSEALARQVQNEGEVQP
jgi:hypothetical protein